MDEHTTSADAADCDVDTLHGRNAVTAATGKDSLDRGSSSNALQAGVGVHGKATSMRMLTAASLLATTLVGCGKPSAVNIELRKENQTLRSRVAELERENAARRQDATLSPTTGPTTLPVDRFDRLFTTHGIAVGRLSGPSIIDKESNRPDSFRVYATPSDAQGDPFKATGSFVIEVFDLTADQPRLQRWTVDTADARTRWRGGAMLYTYVLEFPWDDVPVDRELLLKVTFTDELTGRTFTAERKVSAR
jgi:outer membrane murein-binding lipoprotein Lpp